MINQIKNYDKTMRNFMGAHHHYHLGEDVFLKKGTLLHGTYKNMDGLKEIAKNGLISSWFIDARTSKYPSSVGVWNLKQDYLLKDYIDFYSGGTILYYGVTDKKNNISEIIPYSNMQNLNDKIKSYQFHMWKME